MKDHKRQYTIEVTRTDFFLDKNGEVKEGFSDIIFTQKIEKDPLSEDEEALLNLIYALNPFIREELSIERRRRVGAENELEDKEKECIIWQLKSDFERLKRKCLSRDLEILTLRDEIRELKARKKKK